MFENFYFGLLSLVKDIKIEMVALIYNRFFIGFAFGFAISILLTAILVSENPKHIPILLWYDKCKSYEKLSNLSEDNYYNKSFCSFVKKYHTVRLSFFIIFSIFCLTVLAAVFFS